MICIFDIESIPDVELLKEVYGYVGTDLEICKKAFKEQKDKSGSEFLPICFHKIVSLSCVLANNFGEFIKVGSFGKSESDFNAKEEIILKEFATFLNNQNPRLISFNGRGFDMPLIALRALKYNICLKGYYESDNKELGKSKWENYRQRYSANFHLDLQDVLGNYGATRALNLNSVCKMAGINGKFEVDGGDIFELVYRDFNLEKVQDYCQSDVINTYWLFLKFELSCGNLTLKEYLNNLLGLKQNLPQDKYYTPFFTQSLQKEIDTYKDQAL